MFVQFECLGGLKSIRSCQLLRVPGKGRSKVSVSPIRSIEKRSLEIISPKCSLRSCDLRLLKINNLQKRACCFVVDCFNPLLIKSLITHICVENTVHACVNCLYLALVQPFGHLFIALNASFCNYESKQINCNSQFLLYIIVRWAAKSKKLLFWPKVNTKNFTFVVSRPYHGI